MQQQMTQLKFIFKVCFGYYTMSQNSVWIEEIWTSVHDFWRAVIPIIVAPKKQLGL